MKRRPVARSSGRRKFQRRAAKTAGLNMKNPPRGGFRL